MNELQEKFPDMRPINGPPFMGTINGIGLSVCGRRDFDNETGTYIKTYCFTFLFIPVVAFGAYRVADAGNGGWYFLGKEPMSGLAKIWNLLIVASLAGIIGYSSYMGRYNSPEAIAERAVARADQLVKESKFGEASKVYADLIRNNSPQKTYARKQLTSLHKNPEFAGSNLSDAADVISLELQYGAGKNAGQFGEDLYTLAMEMTKTRGDTDPEGARLLLQAIESVAIDEEEYSEASRSVLATLVAKKPGDLSLVCELAEAHEGLEQYDRCVELLMPVADKLGTTVGARILGQIYARQNEFEKALALLKPYCEKELQSLANAEKSLMLTIESEQRSALNRLERSPEFMRHYESASKSQQDELVQERLVKALGNNTRIDAAQQRFAQQSAVVPVALDLGMMQLQVAKTADPTARKQYLEDAEKTFKAIQTAAGESDEYRMQMGQVYYWLGKFDEGKRQFDDLLEANNREPVYLEMVANVIREVGRTSEAKSLADEAYGKAKDKSIKERIALERAAMATDSDERLLWLERASSTSPIAKAQLLSAKASVQLTEGNSDKAVELFRESIATYDAMEESATSLNNTGLSCFALYRLTHDTKDLDEGLRRIVKAISLRPADSILLSNAANLMESVAFADVIGKRMKIADLDVDPSENMLRYFYQTPEQRNAIADEIKNHRAMKKSMGFLSNVILLAPKRADPYDSLGNLHLLFRDVEAITQLISQAENAQPESDTQRILDFYAGKDDQVYRTWYKGRIASLEESYGKTKPGSIERACIAGMLSENTLATTLFDEKVDYDANIDRLTKAMETNPSRGIQSDLISAYLYRASFRLSANNDEYKQIRSKCFRYASDALIIAWAAFKGGSLSKVVLADDDVKRAIELLQDQFVAFPDERNPWAWALVKNADSDLAAETAKVIAGDLLGIAQRKMRQVSTPPNVSDALVRYWAACSQGVPDAADREFEAITKLGVKVPFVLD